MLAITYYFKTQPVFVSTNEKESFFNALIFGFFFITLMILFILYLKKTIVVNIWYKVSVFLAMFLTLNMFFNDFVSLILAIIFMLLRNTQFRNITEFFIYPGIVAVMLPFFELKHIIILMTIFAIYDFVSVRITKHMIFLAKGQMQNNAFSGLEIKYVESSVKRTKLLKLFKTKNPIKSSKKITESKIHSNEEVKTAILGGGDIAFPMLFISFLSVHYGLKYGLFALIGAFFGLIFIFFRSKNKFYPALPYIIFFMFLTTALSVYI